MQAAAADARRRLSHRARWVKSGSLTGRAVDASSDAGTRGHCDHVGTMRPRRRRRSGGVQLPPRALPRRWTHRDDAHGRVSSCGSNAATVPGPDPRCAESAIAAVVPTCREIGLNERAAPWCTPTRSTGPACSRRPDLGPSTSVRSPCTDWQRRDRADGTTRRQLIRGLLHSDGCRVINRVHRRLSATRRRRMSYVRYFLSNHSGDIRRAVHRSLQHGWASTLGTTTGTACPSRDDASVARLDTFVGPEVVARPTVSARSGIRTRTPLRAADFESAVSAVAPSGPAAARLAAPTGR